MEAPVFEFPLQNTIVSAGVDVVLKCIIAGTPYPEGKFFPPFERGNGSNRYSNCSVCFLCYSYLDERQH